jgi:hypothetical protein
MGRLGRIVLIGVVLLLAAEGFVRARASALPPPLKWFTTDLDRKVQQIAELERGGGASVVFIGSSTVDSAIDPSAIDLADGERPAYNAAVRGGTMRMVSSWTKTVVLPRLRPDMVVIGVASDELSTLGPREREYERSYFDAPAVRHLTGRETPLQHAERRLESVSALARYRTWLRDPRYARAALGFGAAPTVTTTAFGDPVAPDGQYRFFLRRSYGAKIFRAINTRGSAIGDDQLTALRGLLSYLETRVDKVALVNMPVTKDYVADRPADQRRNFESLLRTEARRAGATYLPTGVWPKRSFADPVHTNAIGSKQLTAMVDNVTPREPSIDQAPQPPPPGVATPTTVPRPQDVVTLDPTRKPSISSVPGAPSPPPLAPQAPR